MRAKRVIAGEGFLPAQEYSSLTRGGKGAAGLCSVIVEGIGGRTGSL